MSYSFNSEDLNLIKRLQNDPAILFLGQSYLNLGRSSDFFLTKFKEKFNIQSDQPSFYDVLKSDTKNKDAVRAWGQKIFENISLPANFEQISRFPWSHVYTSAIDSNLVRAFKTDFRTVQPILNLSFKMTNPRNRSQLHETYLFGQLQYAEAERSSPLSVLELSRRRLIANGLLSRLPVDIVTPKGVLLIDGWQPDYDWLSASDFYSVLTLFGAGQVHIFSASEQITNNEFIEDLIVNGKVIPHSEPLSAFLELAIDSELLDLSKISLDEEGFWLFFGNKRVKVPNQLRASINRTAILLNRNMFEPDKQYVGDEFTNEFRDFIAYSATIPRWQGFKHQFAFRREFIDQVLNNLRSASLASLDYPFIVHGQASSGKTTGLGQIAYEILFNEDLKIAVLFIERSYRRLDENSIRNIDEFCLWCEENGADRTIILYDGMLNYESYYNLVTNLASRGRKVAVIGSCYLQKKTKNRRNFIEVPIKLTENETKLFEVYIKKMVTDKPALMNIIKSKNDQNFLSILYHYLPDSKSNISQTIRNEAKYYSDQIKAESFSKAPKEKDLFLRDLLEELGFKASGEEDDNSDFNKDLVIGGENEKIATHFINLVMVIGKLGLAIPFELLIRALGVDSIRADFFHFIPNTDLIRWHEEHNGNIDVGPRTQLEANIYSNTLGGIAAEVDFIKQVLSEVRDSANSTQEDKEIEFASRLIQFVKNANTPYRRYIFDYATILTELRKSKQAVHPRLMLQEAALLQESVKEKQWLPANADPFEILGEAESVIRDAIEIENSPKSPTYIYLKVELASILGSKAYQSKQDYDLAGSKGFYEQAREEIRSFSFSSQNYHALDILLWTLRDQASMTTNPVELSKLYAEALHYIQFGEEEGVIQVFQEDFLERKVEISHAFKDFKLSEEAFQQLLKIGSKAGYFLRCKEFLGDVNLYKEGGYTEKEKEKIKRALNYLLKYFAEILYDSQCMYLLLKLWWLSKTGHPIFFKERTLLKFSNDDWMYLQQITSLLLETSNAYISPTAKYLKAIAQFQNADYLGAFETFKQLSDETDQSTVGGRRIRKYYFATNSDGTPREFHGILEGPLDYRNSSSFIIADGIPRKIRCFYGDFRRDLQKDAAIDFNITFNFIGPIAAPVKSM